MTEGSKTRIKLRMMELSVAIVIVWGVIQITTFIHSTQRQMVRAEQWLSVREIFVPDHVTGSNPEIVYDRIIHEPFRGFWVVEVQGRERDSYAGNRPVCSGAGVSDYDPDDVIPGSVVTWEWFIGRTCAVPPGEYRLRITYDLTRINWPAKQVVAFSNVFTVLPAE